MVNIIYKERIAKLISALGSQMNLVFDPGVVVSGRAPTMASSEFLTNKQQGDWAEKIVLEAINQYSNKFVAVKYGRSESLSAGDDGFGEFYAEYQRELNEIGKRPDILIFNKGEDEDIYRAVAAIEVRSSSFLIEKYNRFIDDRNQRAKNECMRLRDEILSGELSKLLGAKNAELLRVIESATSETFCEIDFRAISWSSSEGLRKLSSVLKALKEQIAILHKRDYLSITPKVEDIALVNRWIQKFGVPHYYLQVFFDKGYIIPFEEILRTASDPMNEGEIFSIERDVKNQGKTTIKIDVKAGKEVIGKIDMPRHSSEKKEFDRGRVLFFVKFDGGKGYLDNETFVNEVMGNAKH